VNNFNINLTLIKEILKMTTKMQTWKFWAIWLLILLVAIVFNLSDILPVILNR